MSEITPITREEKLWNGEDLEPLTREEMYIKRIFDKTQTIPDKPLTRKEILMEKAGEGGGGDVTIKQLSATANGTYSEEGTAYSPVNVNVPMPENAYLLKEASGSLVSFSDGADLPMPSFICNIDAQQDLHGYDAPWVGGAGKNKLANVLSKLKSDNTSGTWSGNVYTINGGTIEILTDTADNILGYKVNGSFTETVSFLLEGTAYKLLSDFANNSNFVISQEVKGTGVNGFTLQRQETGSNIYIPNNQIYTAVNPSSDTTNHYRPILRFNNGDSIANKTYVLMIRNPADSSDFAPYSNICPISGWTEEVITVADDLQNPTVTHTTTIPFTDGQGQSVEVFGGSVDVVNGTSGNKLTHGFVVLNGSNTENWTADVPSSGKRRFSCDTLPSLGYTDDTRIHAISNYYKNTTSTIYDTMSEVFILRYINGTNRIDIMTEVFQTVEELTAFLSQTPLQIRYELATPTTFYTQPTSIKSLDGENNVSASTGEIETLEYFTKEA